MSDSIQLIPPAHMAAIAVVVGAGIRFLKTDTMSNWLDRLPPKWLGRIPAPVLPWLALLLAMAVSIVDLKITASDSTWKDAVGATVQGVLSGSLAIAGHETLAKTVGRFIYKAPPTIVVFAIGFACLLTGTAACGPLFAALPVVIAAVVDAGQIVDSIVAFVDRWFVSHPDPAKQKIFDDAVVKVRSSLDVLVRAANGADDLNNDKIDAAFAEFKQAYLDLLNIARPYGVRESALPSTHMRATPDELIVPQPIAFKKGAR